MASGSEIQVLATQVAGHTVAEGAPHPMMAGNGKVYKPLQCGSRGNRELEFYNSVPSVAPEFAEFIPKCYGMHTMTLDGKNVSFLALEDLTQGFPPETLCVADIKMGNVTYDYFASEKKIALEISKSRGTTTESHAFRFCGMRVYEGTDHGGIVKYDKKWGKNLAGDKINDAIRTFMAHKVYLIPQVIDQLKAILDWFERNTLLNFVGTSLLIIYNGSPLLAGADPDNVIVKIIDFAHVCNTREGEKDNGYILGLQNLLRAFEEVRCSS